MIGFDWSAGPTAACFSPDSPTLAEPYPAQTREPVTPQRKRGKDKEGGWWETIKSKKKKKKDGVDRLDKQRRRELEERQFGKKG